MLARAFDESGNRRPTYRLEEGDLIEWKRNGERGFKFGRVTALCERDVSGESRKCPIRIMPLDQAKDPTGGRDRWIGRDAVMRIYERDGKTRKQPRPEDQPTAQTTV